MAKRTQDERDAAAVMNAFRPRWLCPSNSTDEVYEIIQHMDGHISCNCMKWINKAGGSRNCSHVKKVIKNNRLDIVRIDEHGVSFVRQEF